MTCQNPTRIELNWKWIHFSFIFGRENSHVVIAANCFTDAQSDASIAREKGRDDRCRQRVNGSSEQSYPLCGWESFLQLELETHLIVVQVFFSIEIHFVYFSGPSQMHLTKWAKRTTQKIKLIDQLRLLSTWMRLLLLLVSKMVNAAQRLSAVLRNRFQMNRLFISFSCLSSSRFDDFFTNNKTAINSQIMCVSRVSARQLILSSETKWDNSGSDSVSEIFE